jgi:pyruvate dehydrogenase E1 component beta subunit
MAFHQLENHAARLRGRSCGRFHVPLVVRMPYGGGVRALEHHSESREVYFAHTPGLKMVIPSTPRNARALMVSAIRDPDPVVFFEPKASYRAFKEEVPEDEETLTLGKAEIVQEGDDLTLLSYGAMMRPTLEAARKLEKDDGIGVEVIDLLTISPMDHAAFAESAKKTGRVVVVHEAPRSFGTAAEITARLIEKSFLYLEAPVKRVTGFDVHIPLFQKEKVYLPGVGRILKAARQTMEF